MAQKTDKAKVRGRFKFNSRPRGSRPAGPFRKGDPEQCGVWRQRQRVMATAIQAGEGD